MFKLQAIVFAGIGTRVSGVGSGMLRVFSTPVVLQQRRATRDALLGSVVLVGLRDCSKLACVYKWTDLRVSCNGAADALLFSRPEVS